jgi:hypothetical protein
MSHGNVVITDDDEGDIFEDGEEEDEGYLFAGQGVCTEPNTCLNIHYVI